MLSSSWRRTVRVALADLRLAISFYIARSIVKRALGAERKKAQQSFKEVKRLREIEIR